MNISGWSFSCDTVLMHGPSGKDPLQNNTAGYGNVDAHGTPQREHDGNGSSSSARGATFGGQGPNATEADGSNGGPPPCMPPNLQHGKRVVHNSTKRHKSRKTLAGYVGVMALQHAWVPAMCTWGAAELVG